MEPLDLDAQPPRSPRDAIDGVLFLARSIDKARAALPGGKSGAYFLTKDGLRTLNGLFFRRLGCLEPDFVGAVASAPDDEAVAAWLRERAEPAAIDAWNALLLSIRMRDLDAATVAQLRDIYAGVGWSDDDLLVDFIEADDRRIFGLAENIDRPRRDERNGGERNGGLDEHQRLRPRR